MGLWTLLVIHLPCSAWIAWEALSLCRPLWQPGRMDGQPQIMPASAQKTILLWEPLWRKEDMSFRQDLYFVNYIECWGIMMVFGDFPFYVPAVFSGKFFFILPSVAFLNPL